MADLPQIFSEDVAPVIARLQTSLEGKINRSLAPADIEVLLLNVFAYEIQLLRISGNEAFRQNLVDFSTGTMLEYLAALPGVTRLPASGAVCTLRFNLVDGHNAVQLPAGIRVQSIDGQVIFTTISAIDIVPTNVYVDVVALCQTAGTIGNGYTVGKVNIPLDPQPFVTSVANIDTTAGGNNAETDDELRSRIKLAPSSFSVAGPKDAYKFFAKSASPTIVDVSCVTTNPGEVTLYPLCADGTLASSGIKDEILSICSDEKVRPQNDSVLVADPSVVEYAISVNIVTYTGAINADVQSAINSALSAFVAKGQNKLGIDVVVSQLVALSVIPDQVYKAVVITPTSDIVADESTYTRCTGITITITGSNDG